MGKFSEFKQKRSDQKNMRSQQLPCVLLTHGNHSLSAIEHAEKLRNEREMQLHEKVSQSVDSHSEYSPAEHDEIHGKIAPTTPAESMDKNQRFAIDAYTNHSRTLNKALVSYHEGGDFDSRYEKHVDSIDSLLKSKATTKDTHLYSGISWHPGKYLGKSRSADVHLPAYTSMSTSINQASGFSKNQPASHHDAGHDLAFNSEGSIVNHVIKLHVPKGTKAMSVKAHSFVPGEQEVLLHRGHEIEIDHKPTVFHSKGGKVVNVWNARITGHYPADLNQEDL